MAQISQAPHTSANPSAPAALPQTAQANISRDSVQDRSKVNITSQVAWKGDSEDMIRARKSAQRVILTKFKTFWPSDDEAKLAARAFDFEKGEYEVMCEDLVI